VAYWGSTAVLLSDPHPDRSLAPLQRALTPGSLKRCSGMLGRPRALPRPLTPADCARKHLTPGTPFHPPAKPPPRRSPTELNRAMAESRSGSADTPEGWRIS
jgi:hypothetical protein